MVATPDQEDWKHVRKTTNLAFSPNTIREVSLCCDCECPSFPATHGFARAVPYLQGFPVVYQNTLKAAEVLDELCKQGLVDVNDLAWRFTAGKSCCTSLQSM